MLSEVQVETFVSDGFLHLPGAFDAATAAACRELLWEATGCDPKRPSTWTEPVVRVWASKEPPFLEASRSPRLCGALDDLVGKNRWLPKRGLGTFPIRFPSEVDPGDAGWHIDGSFEGEGGLRVNLHSRGRALLCLYLFSDVEPDGAPTRVRVGSHRAVPPILRDSGDDGRLAGEVAAQIQDLESFPVVPAVGSAGDVFLCHPFLVHAATWPHRGKAPRFLGQISTEPTEPLSLHRRASEESPVERAIREALV